MDTGNNGDTVAQLVEKLEALEQQRLALLDGTVDAVITADLSFEIRSYNAATRSLCGWDADEAIGRCLLGLLAAQDRDQSADDIRARLHDAGDWSGRLIQSHEDGRKADLEASLRIVSDGAGRAASIVAILRSAGARRVAQERPPTRQQLSLHGFEAPLTDATTSRAVAGEQPDEDVRRLRDFYGFILDNVHDGIWVSDRNDRLIYVNAEMERIAGVAARDLLGRSVVEDFPLATIRHFITDYRRAGAERTPQPYEARVVTPAGRPTVQSGWLVPRFEGDDYRGMICTIEDVTERVAAQKALSQSETLNRSLLQNARTGIGYYDLEGRVVLLNDLAVQYLGIAPEDYRSKSVEELFGSEAGGTYRKRLERAARSTTSCSFDDEVALPTGSRWFSSHYTRITDVDGTVVGVLIVSHDITERVRAAAALRDSEAKLLAVLDATPFPVAVVDLQDDHIAYWSRSALERFGHTAPTAAEWYEIAYPDPQYRREVVARWKPALEQARETGQAVNAGEYQVTCSDGSVRTCELHAAFIPDALIVTFNDVTDERKTERQRRELEAALAQSDRLASMGTLAAGVAHEINNPLTYLLDNLQSLSDDLPSRAAQVARTRQALAAQRQEGELHDALRALVESLDADSWSDVTVRLDAAQEGAERIRKIARGLNTFSRVDKDRLVPVDLRTPIESASNIAANEIRFRARLVQELGPTQPVLGSEGKLSQVFLNLLLNAAQAIEEGDAAHHRISVRTWQEGSTVLVEVKDTGCGIPPDALDRVFDPFFTTKPVGVGSGLGMTIAHNIVAGHGGTIEVSSEVAKGTRCLLRFPAARSTDGGDRAKPERRREASDVRGRVLVIDDEPWIRRALARTLRKHDVVVADSGEAARAILLEDPQFDVILCDMMMPTMSGMDVHRWLVEHLPHLAQRVVFITGGAFTPKAREFLKRVDNSRVEKPFEPRELRRKVATWILSSRKAAT